MQSYSINLPFPGFYESFLSSELDYRQESESENMESNESEYPDYMRLTQDEFSELLDHHQSYSIACNQVARAYTEHLAGILSELFDFPVTFEFEEMTSPREYNFTTDRIFAKMPAKQVAKMFALSRTENHKTLEKTIKEQFTSYSGFISHYPNSLSTWLESPLPRWDHNELGTLLLACISIKSGKHDESIEYQVYSSLADTEVFYTAFSDSIDWPAFEKDRDELRADKQAEFEKDKEEFARFYNPFDTHYRSADPNQLAFRV